MEGPPEAVRENSDGAGDPSNCYSHPGDRTSSGSGQAGEPLSKKAIAKHILLLHKQYREMHRASVSAELLENQDKVQRMLAKKEESVKWPDVSVPKSASILTSGEEVPEKARVKYKTHLHGSLVVSGNCIPRHDRLPPYKSWSYLMQNELANEVGGRIFYTDATGETIPASDSDEETRRGEGTLEGAHREQEEWVLQRAASELGAGPMVVDVLASRLGAAHSVVLARLNAFVERQSDGAPALLAQPTTAEADFLFEDGLLTCASGFCRRCRTYNCVTHPGPHVRPHHRTTASKPRSEDGSAPPCGATCWRAAQQQGSQPSASACASPAAGAVSPAAGRAPGNAPGGPQAVQDDVQPLGALPDRAGVVASSIAEAAQDHAKSPPLESQPALAGPEAAGTAPTPATSAAAAHISSPRNEEGLAGVRAAQPAAAGIDRAALASVPSRKRKRRSSSAAGEGLQGELSSASSSSAGSRGSDAVRTSDAATMQAETTASSNEWTAFELSALRYGVIMHKGDTCRISRLVGSRTCAQVHARIQRGLPPGPPTLSIPGSPPPVVAPKRPNNKRKVGAPQRRKNASQVVSKRHKHDMGKPWPGYSPCECVGPCAGDCPCLASKNFCEKFCACGPTCSIRFLGCDCKSGCRTKTCPCFAAGHECDTDLCGGCARSLLPGVGQAACPPGALACCNMRLRFRQHKRIAMGMSDIAGWGSFLMEEAKKGELLGEYTGELVNQQEADRRGKAYDRDDNSYLFNLNEDLVIDARRRGNKLRFANHSTDPNCMAKILMVDGDHRVGIFARKDIAPCTELFYDYCYQYEQAPSWARTAAADAELPARPK